MQRDKSNYVHIAKLVNTHGVRGEVRLGLNNQANEDMLSVGSKLYYEEDSEMKSLIIKSTRPHKTFLLVTFEGIDNINDIEYLKGKYIYSEKNEDTVYEDELEGMIVQDSNGNEAKVTRTFDQGAYTSIVVNYNGTEFNIPYIEEVVTEVTDKIYVNKEFEFWTTN